MSPKLALATHYYDEDYWSGGDYELNISFGTLRDKQWERLTKTLWEHSALNGPYTDLYIPGKTPELTTAEVPQATAALTLHGSLTIENIQVGCRVLATRSLFECITLQVPLGMFTADTAYADPLERVYRDIALALFEIVPFEIANLGLQCECKLVAELQANTTQRLEFLAQGNFFAPDHILMLLGANPENYPSVRPQLRWVPAIR
jgi:hypothetical protein